MTDFFAEKETILCGITGINYELQHSLRENADCVLRLFDRGSYFHVLKLTDIWAD